MKELVVVSGKGGTGKTSIVAAFAKLAKATVFADCDVDAANLEILLHAAPQREEPFSGGSCARIVEENCTRCDVCRQVCRFDAVRLEPGNGAYRVDPVSCEGCGHCAWVCPSDAVVMEPVNNGKWFVSGTPWGPLVHAELNPGGENSGKLVTLVRRRARTLALEKNFDRIIADGPPGIGCPVIASVTGASLLLAVTEPTPSGAHDLCRVLDLAAHFRIPAVVCINKWDLNPGLSEDITAEAWVRHAQVIGRLRYEPGVTRALVRGWTIVDDIESPIAKELSTIWRRLESLLVEKSPLPVPVRPPVSK